MDGRQPAQVLPGPRGPLLDMTEAIASIRGRQTAGELTDVVDAEFIPLLSLVLAFALVALPKFS